MAKTFLVLGHAPSLSVTRTEQQIDIQWEGALEWGIGTHICDVMHGQPRGERFVLELPAVALITSTPGRLVLTFTRTSDALGARAAEPGRAG